MNVVDTVDSLCRWPKAKRSRPAIQNESQTCDTVDLINPENSPVDVR